MQVIGRYALFDELARGGMAAVHLGRLLGPGGFTRTVAVKRLHPHLAKDPEFVAMLLDEARLAGRIQHPNVVAMLDVVGTEAELFLVMEYVHGETLVRLLKASTGAAAPVAPPLAAAVLVNVLEGLHAAHEVRGDRGEPLGLVHRDVTPHNIMVRRDGTALVVDFGVAKAAGRFHNTEEGKIKGKLPYMAPEQLRGGDVTRRTDVYAAGAVLWETLVGERLFDGANEAEVLEQLLFSTVEPPGRRVQGVPAALDGVVMRALERDPQKRFATAAEMARAVEAAVAPALASHVAAWLDGLVGDALARQEARLAQLDLTVLDAAVRPGDLPPSFKSLLSGAARRDAAARVSANPPGPSSAPPRASTASTPPVVPATQRSPEPSSAASAVAPPAGAADPDRAPVSRSSRPHDATPAPVGPPSQAAAPPGLRRAWPWFAAATFAGAAVAAWLGLRSGASPAPEGAAGSRQADTEALRLAEDPAGKGAAAASVTPAPPSAAPAPPRAASSGVATAASATATSATSSQSTSPRPGSGAASSRAAAPSRAAAVKPPAVDCAVPYTVDAQGRRIYKRACL
ncbi:protein kinase domain-containing protein [Sorangium sp. So ce131]|uniref:serine/threonine-protein kinase n=1 Tax=Sorangium sp. So ce131 TaxID=3133282 RepID=UPI003F5EE1F7